MAASRDQLLQAAEKSLSKGKLDQALKDYLRVLDDNPKDIPTLNKVGDLYVRMNRPSDSIPYFERIADFYSKDGFFLKAIAIYKKMATIDPADLRIQVRLADLYRAAGQKDQAVMQYGLIGSMLLKRGAHDEAAQVFQKAL